MAGETDLARKSLWIHFSLIFVILGIALSIYSLNHHLEVRASGTTDALCNINAQFNCDEEALSPYAEPIKGLPLGVFGLGYFLGQGVLLLLGLRNGKNARDHLQAYAVMASIGITTSVILGGISAISLGTLCLICLSIYALCFAQGAVLFMARTELPRPFSLRQVANGGGTAALVLALVIGGFQWAKPAIEKERFLATSKPQSIPSLAEKSENIPLSFSAYSGLGEDYRKGGDNAAVVIQEFADFQCPGCARMAETLASLQREYGDKILVVYRSYPLDSACNSSIQGRLHDYACKAAVMARCAGQLGKFWNYHDTLYQNQTSINETKLKEWAQGLGLAKDQVESCWTSHDILEKIKDDIAVANRLGVDSTPTLFINGRKILGGRDIDTLRGHIDGLLNP